MTEHVQSFVNSGIILKTNNKRGNRRKWGGKRETKTQSNDNENIVYWFLPPKNPSMEYVSCSTLIFYYFRVGTILPGFFKVFEILLFQARALSTYFETITFLLILSNR